MFRLIYIKVRTFKLSQTRLHQIKYLYFLYFSRRPRLGHVGNRSVTLQNNDVLTWAGVAPFYSTAVLYVSVKDRRPNLKLINPKLAG